MIKVRFQSSPEEKTLPSPSKSSKQVFYITFSLFQAATNLIPLLLAKLPHKCNVNIRDAPALDPFIALQTAELITHVVKIVLEIVVDAFLHRVIEAALLLRISVSEVMAPAGLREVEFAKIIGRTAAAVARPDKTGRILRIFGGDEGRYAVLENEFLECIHRAGIGRGRLWCRRRRLRAVLDTTSDIRIPWAKIGVEFAARAAIVLDASAVT